jgi:hypothetical protein
MFKPSREQARQLFFDTWRKYRQREILSGIETIALGGYSVASGIP